MSVFGLVLLVLATIVHVVQLFIPPAQFAHSCQQQRKQVGVRTVQEEIIGGGMATRAPRQG